MKKALLRFLCALLGHGKPSGAWLGWGMRSFKCSRCGSDVLWWKR